MSSSPEKQFNIIVDMNRQKREREREKVFFKKREKRRKNIRSHLLKQKKIVHKI